MLFDATDIYQIIAPGGGFNEAVRESDDFLKQLYEEMVYIRMADDKCVKLQRQGRMGTYASLKGQEAAQVGSAHALEKSDWVIPAFRELGIMHLHGVALEDIYRYWGGFEIGSKMPENVNVLPVSIPVGTHPLHAVGIAWAMKMQNKKSVAVAYFSDGATSTGDFHEAMNFAGVFKVPCIFFCQNNQYAISTPRVKQTASKTLAQKAAAYGFPGMQVDGNDVLAVYAVMKEAVTRAKNGEGPFFVEAVTYRMGDHTTSDDPKKYRSAEEEKDWAEKDPIKRTKLFLEKRKLWDENFQRKIEESAAQKISKAVEAYEATPLQTPGDMFKYVYAKMTPQMTEQLQYLNNLYN